MNIMNRLLLTAALPLMMTGCAQAQVTADSVIDKTIAAYGGAALTGLKSIRVQDDVLRVQEGYGYFAGTDSIQVERRDFNIDFSSDKVSLEIFYNYNSEMYHARTVITDDGQVWMNYVGGIYHDMENEGYHGFARPIRPVDTLLAYELAHHKESAEIAGASNYLGHPHQIVRYEIPQFPGPVSVSIRTDTGLISLMETDIDENSLRYSFGNHRKVDGLAYAHETKIYNGDDFIAQAINRRISANMVSPDLFRMDAGLTEEPEMVDRSQLSVSKIGERAHLVGQSYQHSVFVDAGDHLIAIDTSENFNKHLEAYRETTGSTKPLHYAVISHHHSHHTSGAKAALEAGATIVTTDSARLAVEEEIGSPIPGDKLKLISAVTQLGPLALHVINTPLTEDQVITYLPDAKAVYQADLYVGLYKDMPWTPGIGGKALKDYLTANNLEIDTVLSAHSPKLETWEDFAKGVANYKHKVCFNNREICRD